MDPTAGVNLLLAAGPSHPGARELWERALALAANGNKVDAMFTGAGVTWATRADEMRRAAASGARVACCSRSVRDRRVDPLGVDPSVRWSSLTAWWAEASLDACVWAAFP